ncbi:Mgm101p-domain-containing protein [Meira miltonrushii]|uniref:Mitochondrial genome maintenance protein MGM101 n=1 Tax=Meira miltonrushii TaxID=1280837 RepID=A0A316VI86_9BASI|nr:Mgm101p-domain-containing protein [Meira miltonrushii]PWN37312.1 Mgm101p-domain-containing protein [Meira miltonrushii]
MIVFTSSATNSLRLCVRRSTAVGQLSTRLYVTKPAWAASKTASAPAQKQKESNEFATTSAKELHPLPSSVKDAGKPSSSSDSERYDELGNSVSPADISSRPSGPGPSGPVTDAERAAPRYTQPSSNGNGSNGDVSEKSNSSFDWATSFNGMSTIPFPEKVAQVLEEPVNEDDIEIKPDGLLYLPEIKYRRILNRAFGPGGWGLAPRSETNVSDKVVSREWALICLGRFVSTARGEQEYFDPSGVATATEAAKSNALMRCCKDLGIAHELWSPRFIRSFKEKKCVEVFVENVSTHKKRKLWRRKDGAPFEYPWKESK